MLELLDGLMAWFRMNFKSKKSQSLSLRRGKIDAVTTFTVAGNKFKSLGRWYDSSMKDTKKGHETAELATTTQGII